MTGVVEDGAEGIAELVDRLRLAGVQVSTAQTVACADALSQAPTVDAWTCYWTGRLTLCSEPTHLPVYDEVFAAWAAGRLGDGVPGGPPPQPAPVPAADGTADAVDAEEDPAPSSRGQQPSVRHGLLHRRIGEASEDELLEIERLVQQLRVALPDRPTRRRRPGPGLELDLERSLDRALATGGELLEPATRQRRVEPRRLVLVLDVSSSMSAHARVLLRLGLAARRAGGRGGGRVEVFAFGTRLTRLTPHLGDRDPGAALAAAADAVTDVEGGTRIGASLGQLVRGWGRRRGLRGAVVVICSDGLERGDPELLGAAVARLRRHAHRVVWVNPLAGDPRYEPTQRGMAAALPHVDVFLPGHDLASLEDLVEVLVRL